MLLATIDQQELSAHLSCGCCIRPLSFRVLLPAEYLFLVGELI
jgi:hypothetical protein